MPLAHIAIAALTLALGAEPAWAAKKPPAPTIAAPASPAVVIPASKPQPEESLAELEELEAMLAEDAKKNTDPTFREELQVSTAGPTLTLEELAKAAQRSPPPMKTEAE